MLTHSPDLGLSPLPSSRAQSRPCKAAALWCIPMLLVTLALIALANPVEASTNVFGQCAHQRDVEQKIAACIEASKSTSYPWILHWVYRELARAHRERGEIQMSITSYAQSLAAQEREWVRREMEELTLFTQRHRQYSREGGPSSATVTK